MVRWAAVILIAVFLFFGSYNFENVGEAFKYYGEKISLTHPEVGIMVLAIAFFFFIFTDNFLRFLKKAKKYKVKQKF